MQSTARTEAGRESIHPQLLVARHHLERLLEIALDIDEGRALTVRRSVNAIMSALQEHQRATAETARQSRALRQQVRTLLVRNAYRERPSGREPVSLAAAAGMLVSDAVLIDSAVHAVTSELDPGPAATALAGILSQAIPLDWLTLIEINGNRYHRLAVCGEPNDVIKQDEVVPLAASPLGPMTVRDDPAVSLDTSDVRFPLDHQLSENGVRSYIVVPVNDDDRTVGALGVFFKDAGVPDPWMINLLQEMTVAISPWVCNILTHSAMKRRLDELEIANDVRSDSFAMLAHDVRVPLSLVAAHAELLAARSDNDDPEAMQLLAGISRITAHLEKIAEQVLEVSMIGSENFTIAADPVDLGDVVRGVTEELSEVKGFDDFILDLPDDLPLAKGDEHAQWRILSNLVSNALKATPEGQPVLISARAHPKVVKVSVQDYGAGISAEDMPKLFGKYSRLPYERNSSGTGLGLYIAKTLVEQQGGTIWLSSEPGSGSVFSYSVPRLG
jgi:signal transduction histidine kinase